MDSQTEYLVELAENETSRQVFPATTQDGSYAFFVKGGPSGMWGALDEILSYAIIDLLLEADLRPIDVNLKMITIRPDPGYKVEPFRHLSKFASDLYRVRP